MTTQIVQYAKDDVERALTEYANCENRRYRAELSLADAEVDGPIIGDVGVNACILEHQQAISYSEIAHKCALIAIEHLLSTIRLSIAYNETHEEGEKDV